MSVIAEASLRGKVYHVYLACLVILGPQEAFCLDVQQTEWSEA